MSVHKGIGENTGLENAIGNDELSRDQHKQFGAKTITIRVDSVVARVINIMKKYGSDNL